MSLSVAEKMDSLMVSPSSESVEVFDETILVLSPSACVCHPDVSPFQWMTRSNAVKSLLETNHGPRFEDGQLIEGPEVIASRGEDGVLEMKRLHFIG